VINIVQRCGMPSCRVELVVLKTVGNVPSSQDSSEADAEKRGVLSMSRSTLELELLKIVRTGVFELIVVNIVRKRVLFWSTEKLGILQ
jgi:hypothetical protein